MKKIYCFIAAVLLIAWQCDDSVVDSETKLGADVNSKHIVYGINTNFNLDLDVHADGGYQWFASISDSAIVTLDSISYKPKEDKNMVGGLTVGTFYFCTKKMGNCLIELKEKRGWEKDIKPINNISFAVSVR